MIELNKGALLHPDNLPVSAWSGHIPFVGWLIEAARPRSIVELGTHHGASYLAMCQQVVRSGLDCRCYAVDTWAGDEHSGEYGQEVYDKLSGYHGLRYGGFSELLRMTFQEARKYFSEGSVDLLHIDGLHTYEAVIEDLESWKSALSSRAVVLMHDINVRERGFGVWRAWEELAGEYPRFAFTHGHGLGVLLVGEDAPDALVELCKINADSDRLLVRGLFERLGVAIARDDEATRLREAVGYYRALAREPQQRDFDEVARRLDEIRGELGSLYRVLLGGQAGHSGLPSADSLPLFGQSIVDSLQLLRGDLQFIGSLGTQMHQQLLHMSRPLDGDSGMQQQESAAADVMRFRGEEDRPVLDPSSDTPDPEGEFDAKAEPAIGAITEAESESVAGSQAETAIETKAEADTEADTETETETETEGRASPA